MTTGRPRLSLCIATYNRSAFLGAMLESIIGQVTNECEIVVSDNASTDDTAEVVATFARRFDRVRYFRQDENKGIDRNFDRAVEISSGEYCWLLPDDDVIKPDAVATILDALRQGWSLITLNVEFMDFTLSRVIQRGVTFQSDRVYEPEEMDRLYTDAHKLNGYIGSFVIRRSIWLARDRQRYFGTDFIHIGVIYQRRLPGKALLLSRPLVSMRMGNAHEWWSRMFDISMSFPQLVLSLALSESIKREARQQKPWRNAVLLLWLRALGAYSLREYQRDIQPKLQRFREMLTPRLVASLPVPLVHTLFVLFLRLTRRSVGGSSPEWLLEVLRESRIQRRDQPTGPADRSDVIEAGSR